MSTYKVIQDIEADDKLLGPLTFRQFVYAGITAFCLWFCYVSIAKGAPFLLPIFIIPGVITAFFAFPWSKEQPTEIWALARIRFLFKPRKRIWNQAGIKELVTITVPKKIEHVYSDGLSQTEVRSRLTALASTIDSRGWAIKNTANNPYVNPAFAAASGTDDRLINPASIPQDVPAVSEPYEDMLDANLNPKAQQFDAMLQANAQEHRQQLINTMQQPTTPVSTGPVDQSTSQQPAADYWFLNQPDTQNVPAGNSMFGQQAVLPGSQPTDAPISDIDETQAVEELRKNQQNTMNMQGHLPTLLPLAEQQRLAEERARAQAAAIPANPTPQPVQSAPDTAILDLARNDDLNISTIARQAQKAQEDDGEVVISLR